MKNRLLLPACTMILFSVLSSFKLPPQGDQLKGAWHLQTESVEQVLIFEDGYFTHTVYDQKNKKFISSYGGVYKPGSITVELKTEFDTRNKENVGLSKTAAYLVENRELDTDITGIRQKWMRLDEGKDNLAGVWRITGRMVDGKMNEMQRGDRKTLKLLSATRFQWMAINPATKEFMGTGGGTYSFQNGRYVENIEFFSRDSTRVGASLTFNGSVSGDTWNHSGKSSKGDPINENWTREKY